MAAFTIGWGLLNLGLAITIFVISYRNFRIYSQRYGSVATGILLLLSVAMCHSPAKKQAANANPSFFEATVPASVIQSNSLQSCSIQLIDLGFSTLSQTVIINRPDSTTARLSSFVNLNGFMSGIYWTPIHTSVTLLTGRRLRYNASGSIQWLLLGMPIYTQVKHFTGDVPLNRLKEQ